jgi:CRP/FNR family transcriptional regulator, cyclic AMP receptor protein
MSHHVPIEEQLARVPLFEGVSEGDLQRVAHLVARIHEPAGEVLTKEGESGHELMIVLDGEVEVRHGGRVVATLGQGDYLGEIALLEPAAKRSATSVATTPVTIAFISRHDFENLLADMPTVAARVRSTEAARLGDLDEGDTA